MGSHSSNAVSVDAESEECRRTWGVIVCVAFAIDERLDGPAFKEAEGKTWIG
jgi:hypothetical protein